MVYYLPTLNNGWEWALSSIGPNLTEKGHAMNKMATKTFLLVEDDLNDAHLVKMEFYNVPRLRLRHVTDGDEAIEYLEGKAPYNDRNESPIPDVILLDLKMPRVSGFEFLEWLHNKSPNNLRLIPVIVMSGSNLVEDVNRAYALGANCYLQKPADWARFREQMARLGIFWGDFVETPIVPHQ